MRLDKTYVGGVWRDAEAVAEQDIINPAIGISIGTLALSGAADGDRAVAAAQAAFDTWGEASVAERKAVLERVLSCYEARKYELANATTTEMGAPVTMSVAAQYGAGLGHLLDFIKAIDKVHWVRTPDVGDGSDRIVMEPMCVAVLITPWNWPMKQITLKVGAALVAVCTMVLKPSELAPL